jgi:hypothetical protein
MDELSGVAKFRNILKPGDVFEGIPCQKLAIEICWFSRWRLLYWLPVSATRTLFPTHDGVVLAMITHCKELREIGVVLDYRKESRVHTLDGRDDLRRRWKACEELQGQKMPELRVWDAEGNKVERLDRK